VVFPESVLEQQVTHFVMGLALIGTMTRPLLVVLGAMPRALFAGVFLVVGWGSIEGNAIIHKIVFLLRESRFIDPQEPLRRVRKRAIVHFVFWQLLDVLSSVVISQTIAAIGFPVIITARLFR
jgi:boron transporter